MAADQRYCLECGQRRGDPRLPFMDAVVLMDTVVKGPRQAAPPPPPKKTPADVRQRDADRRHRDAAAGAGRRRPDRPLGRTLGIDRQHHPRGGESAERSRRNDEERRPSQHRQGFHRRGFEAKANKAAAAAASKTGASGQTHATESFLHPANGVKLAPPEQKLGEKCSKRHRRLQRRQVHRRILRRRVREGGGPEPDIASPRRAEAASKSSPRFERATRDAIPPRPPLRAPAGVGAGRCPQTAAPAASSSAYGPDLVVDLERRRDQLTGRVAELQWDLGGLVYEMAIRNRIRVDVLVQRAAALQDADAELSEVERIVRMEQTGTAGTCGSCGAPHSSGATYCWQCGNSLLSRSPATRS